MTRLFLLIALLLVALGCGGADTYSPTVPQPGTPSFTVTVAPTNQTVVAGSPGLYTVTVRSVGGFSDPVTFSVNGLVAEGETTVFTPATVVPSAQGATVQLAVEAPATATFVIVATGGGQSVSTPATLTVNAVPAPDFALAVTPADRTVPIGTTSADFTVRLTSIAGFSSNVTLLASTATPDVSLAFGQTPLVPTAQGATTPLVVSRSDNVQIASTRGFDDGQPIVVTITARSPGVPDKTATVTLRFDNQGS